MKLKITWISARGSKCTITSTDMSSKQASSHELETSTRIANYGDQGK